MQNITIPVPDDVLRSLNLKPDKIGKELVFAAAVKLYEMGKLSSGAAANLAGIPKVVFLSKLADYNIDSFSMTEEELLKDLHNA